MVKCKHSRDWQSKLDVEEIKMKTKHCLYNSNDFINCAWPKKAAIDNQLLAEMNQVLYKNCYCTLQGFNLCLLSSDYWFCWCISVGYELCWTVFQLYLFVTRSHKSSVLFLLLSCVVLVLHSYQESTLLWRPWIPLMKIKLCVMKIMSKIIISDGMLHFSHLLRGLYIQSRIRKYSDLFSFSHFTALTYLKKCNLCWLIYTL